MRSAGFISNSNTAAFGLLQSSLVPYALTMVTALIIVMASLSQPTAHPDEKTHVRAAQYYQTHVLPPEVCDPDVILTYSPYGYSRLHTNEIAYLLAGRFARLIDVVPIDIYLKLRYFNVALFVWLLVLAHRKLSFRPAAAALLLSPQLWYLFSYFNSDALALFTSMGIVYQLVEPTSVLRRAFVQSSRGISFAAVLVTAVLLSLLLLSKQNFYFFGMYLGLCAISYVWRAGIRICFSRYWLRAAGVAIIAAGVFAVWVGTQEIVNDFERSERVNACVSQTAHDRFLPDVALEESSYTLLWRAKGNSLAETFKQWRKTVFHSAFGYYGYLQIPGDKIYYSVVGFAFGAIVLYLAVSVLLRGDGVQRWFVLSAIATAVALGATALWVAWNVDFQAQGRYLAPVIPIIAFILGSCRGRYRESTLFILMAFQYALSLYSFLYIGLAEIPRA